MVEDSGTRDHGPHGYTTKRVKAGSVNTHFITAPSGRRFGCIPRAACLRKDSMHKGGL